MIEPYRYTCPECGTTVIGKHTTRDTWYCKVCPATGFNPYDKKLGKVMTV